MAAADYFDQNDNQSLAFNSLRLGAKKGEKKKRKKKKPHFSGVCAARHPAGFDRNADRVKLSAPASRHQVC